MGQGRNPKATELLKKQGTFREDRHGDRVHIENALTISPSNFLTAKEKKIWEKWYQVLQENNILKETDEVAFGLLCKTFNRVEILSKEFKKTDDYIYSYTSDVGAKVVKTHPKYAVLVESEKNLLKLLTEFGMTPASRNKVKMALDKGVDPFAELENMDS
ncbi:phage terminase small subunit P27 family [Dyadobacter sp. CY345]|uniref:phage terminase small subunit P27 family n=1 Tax=Dyadobacter sp. CY345 TaxID=2909335 RepID=UPI001F3E0AF8|nr:phage terminase small subunit P27 family [Dyadobacter sp. CY345]MCF2443642.1 phage terminase small subunit P27 family [Dyadobacter sp. CY345]